MTTQELLARARQARGAMALADTQTKDRALLAMAEELEADMAPILAAKDVYKRQIPCSARYSGTPW